MSHRYCRSSQVSPKGGVTNSMSASEKSVVMCSLVNGAPSASGWRVCAIMPSGETRSDSFSTPLRPPRNTARSPELTSPASRRSKLLSTTLRNAILGFSLSGQLGHDFYLHQETTIDQALHLHPGGGRQPLLAVE